MKFKIEESYHGYVRGTRTIIVEAPSKEEAINRKLLGKVIHEDHDRDDTETEIQSIKEGFETSKSQLSYNTDDYDVYDCCGKYIGTVELKEDATWQDMPESIEINGHTYNIEN